MDFMALATAEGKCLHKKKGDMLFAQGDRNSAIYWLRSGLLKAYYLTPEGKEFVKSFILEGDIIGSLSSCYANAPCSFSVLCLEDTDVIEIPFATIYRYSQTQPSIASHMIDMLLNFAMKKEKREFEFLCLSPETRYRQLAQNSPALLNRITQNDLAKYLGVTAVGLSRIKKRVMSR